jgi:ketosteroid isomerase-like protein
VVEVSAALDPFFRVVEQGLAGLADGAHFYALHADDVVVEYVVSVPGYPRRIEGRAALEQLYSGYGDTMSLRGADLLGAFHDREKSVVVLEYVVHGRSVATGKDYDNHFVSIVTIRDRKIVHWRDYMDPVAVFDALGWP